MNPTNTSNKLKKHIALAALSGATICSLFTSCAVRPHFINDDSPNIMDNPSISDESIPNNGVDNSPEYTNSNFFNNKNTPNSFIEESREDISPSQSYNVYLYNDGRALNTDATLNVFGFQMSKETENADRRLLEGDYTPIYIELSEDDYNTFATLVDSQTVTYVYSDLYDIQSSLNESQDYESQVSNQKNEHTDLICSIKEIPSREKLIQVINNNTSEFLRENYGYNQLPSSYTNLIADTLVSTIETYYNYLDEDTLAKIYCMMNDVIVVDIDSSDFAVNKLRSIYNARVTDDGVVMIDTKQIAKLNQDDSIKRVIDHEVAHLFQRMCPDHRLEGLTQIGNSEYFDKLENDHKINTLHFQWLYEAAAEQMSMKNNNAKTPLIYKNMVSYLHTLDLITLIRPGYEENSIAISQLSNDHKKILEVFGAKTPEEEKEIIEMLYSICYIQNGRADFNEVYENEYGSIDGKEVSIKLEMKQSIIKTMTKYFYKNLAERVAHADVTMQDAFYLINVFESSLNLHLVYDDLSRYDINKETIDFYIDIQNAFFDILATNNNMSFDEIENTFNNYALVIKTDNKYQRNGSFSWLNDQEIEYVGDVLTTNIQSLSTNIRNLDFISDNKSK